LEQTIRLPAPFVSSLSVRVCFHTAVPKRSNVKLSGFAGPIIIVSYTLLYFTLLYN